MHLLRIRVATLVTAAALLFAGTARAQGAGKDDEGAIRYRQSLMESIGGDMASIGNILKYGLPFTANVQVHAESLASHAKLEGAAFERKVTAGPTDAEPAIWEKPDKFEAKVQAFQDETAKLVEAAKTKDPAQIGPQLKATGKSCGGCHDSFRKPKEESYKRSAGDGDD